MDEKLDVILLNLPTGVWYKEKLAYSNSMPPLGILYLASYLQKHDYTVKIIDFAVEGTSIRDFRKILSKARPKIIGMTTYNESWLAQGEICKLIKNELPDAKIIAGGAFASFCYDHVLKESQTDYVLKGEGEYSFLQLCDLVIKNDLEIDINKIPGLYRKEKEEIISNPAAIRIRDLDSLPFPNRDLVDLSKYVMPYTIATTRGCPGECIFCSSKAFWGKKVIMRSAENVYDEVMYLNNKYNTNIFYITDDTFTASKKRCLDFCQMLKESGKNFTWGCESRADVIDENFLEVLYYAGCRKIQFGLESGDNDILKKLKKDVTIEEIENAVKCAYKFGMHIQLSYIIGHAFDTEETVEKTLAFAQELRDRYGAKVVCSVNTPFPGTEQYEKREELGISIKTNRWEKFVLNNPIIKTNHLSTNQLRYYLDKGQSLV